MTLFKQALNVREQFLEESQYHTMEAFQKRLLIETRNPTNPAMMLTAFRPPLSPFPDR